MDINTQNSSGMMNGMPPSPSTEKKVGPIVGALIIVLILIIAALYFFGSRLNNQTPVETSSQSSQEAVNMTATATQASQADDVDSLQADLDVQMKDVDYSF